MKHQITIHATRKGMKELESMARRMAQEAKNDGGHNVVAEFALTVLMGIREGRTVTFPDANVWPDTGKPGGPSREIARMQAPWAIVWDAPAWAFFLVGLRYGSRIRLKAKDGKAAIREAAARVTKQPTNHENPISPPPPVAAPPGLLPRVSRLAATPP